MADRNPESDEVLDRYMDLSRRSDKLRQRLSLSAPSTSPLSTATDYDSFFSSPQEQPASINFSFSFGSPPTWPVSPQPVGSTPDHYTAMAEEDTLYDINQQIKATLTELLNCESVKHDKTFRSWVQARLMDAELELKRYRRRRSSLDKKAIMDACADNLSHTPAFAYRPTF